MNEDKFQEAVAAWLTQAFETVEEEVRLDSTGHYVDFVAHTPFNSYAIEVENSWDSIYSGIGQAMTYAAETGHDPVVVFPADEINDTEAHLLRSHPDTPRIVAVPTQRA